MTTANDMILDMDTFDFSMIDDLVEESAPTEDTTPAPASALDVPDDDSNEMEGLIDESAEEEESEEQEEEEAEEESEESSEEQEDEEDGDEEVDYESYEIQLPSGESVILSDVVKGYKDSEALNSERTEFEAIRKDFEEKSEHVGKMLKLAKLEAERVIEDYKDFDWVSLSKEDPAAYADNREFLDRYRERYEEIHEAIETLDKEKVENEKKEFEAKAKEAVLVLTRDIPGWGPDLYKSLMDYAVENGADSEDISKCVDPTTFKILHKAMQFEKGKQKVTAKVKRIGTPKKVAKAAPKAPTTTVNPKKLAVLKKIEQTGDMTDAFDFLED